MTSSPPANLDSICPRFSAEPSEAEYTAFIVSEYLHQICTFAETPDALIATEPKIPLWFIAVCVVPVYAILGYHVWRNGFAWLGPIGAFMAFNALWGIFAIFWLINKAIDLRGPQVVVDKTKRVIHLPRIGMTVRFDEVHFVSRIWGWYKEAPRSYSYVHEVDLICFRDNAWQRVALLISDGRTATKFAEAIARETSTVVRAAMAKRN